MRTKAACFRVCAGGPILVVYPEGIWYAGVTAERLERILLQHIRDGEPVREWIVARSGSATLTHCLSDGDCGHEKLEPLDAAGEER